MSFPIQCNNVYTNPNGNVSASGSYRSYLTQDIANEFPEWMHIRQNPRSIGQQWLSAPALSLEKISRSLEFNIKSKFINTAPLDEIDLLYRIKLQSNVNFIASPNLGIVCVASPSGVAPSGTPQITLKEATSLEEFYYNVPPTRLEVTASGNFVSTIDGYTWNSSPSGVPDTQTKKFDVWKTRHNLTWCYANGGFRKQDADSLEDYEVYSVDTTYGTPIDLAYYNGCLYWIGKTGSNYFLNITSTRTQEPIANSLDLIASFDITGKFGTWVPGGIIVDKTKRIWLRESSNKAIYEVLPRYDYFLVDKDNRYVYFREKYV